MNGPNPISVLVSMVRSRRLGNPQPHGSGTVDHTPFAEVLHELQDGGVPALQTVETQLTRYITGLQTVDPDSLTRNESLAFWLNLYNAVALDLARRADAAAVPSVLAMRRGFTTPVATIEDEALALDGIEHGKIRRFRDPRIHAALVCGAVSCPTLRFEPFTGSGLNAQLEHQMRSFLGTGGFVIDRDLNRVSASRVFRWYGGDFVAPQRMPTLLPRSRRAILTSLSQWLSPEDRTWIRELHPRLEFQSYDWALGCSVTRRPGTA